MKISKKCVETSAKEVVYIGAVVDLKPVRLPKETPTNRDLQKTEGLVKWRVSTKVGFKAWDSILKEGPLDKKGFDLWHHLIHTPGTMFYYLDNDRSE